MGGVGEQGAEEDDGVDADVVDEFDDGVAEAAPAHVGFDAAQQHDVAVAAGQCADGQAGGGPVEFAADAVDEPDLGAVDLVVVVVLGVQFGEGFGVPDQFEVFDGSAGGVACVVPSFERGNEHRITEDGYVLVRGVGILACIHSSSLRPGPVRPPTSLVGMSTPLHSVLLDALKRRVVIGDGAMGTMLQAADLSLDDFRGLEGCNEILNESRPDVIRGIHRAYFEAGADVVSTNTFGCNLPNLADYDIADRIRDLSERGTRLAREVADEMGPSDDGMPRMVIGSMGPGTKLPSFGHAPYAVLRDAYAEAALGMIDGGADAILVETCQDLLQAKAAIVGSRLAMEQAGRRLPIVTHVTVETTGTMLLGSEIGAALTALEPLGIDLIGLNCATGPAEMSEHLRYLSQHARIPVSVMPNAGLPVAGAERRGVPAGAGGTGVGVGRVRRRLRARVRRRVLRHDSRACPAGRRRRCVR